MFFLWMEIRYAFYFPKFVGAVISCIFIVFGLQLIFWLLLWYIAAYSVFFEAALNVGSERNTV